MLNLNEIQTGSEQKPLELIPDKTPVRAIINLLGGDAEMAEFGQGFLFKKSMSSSAVYCPMEFTIIGGQFDKRRVWHNLFVHGDKLDGNGVPVARNIGLETLRRMIDSIYNLKGADMSPEAQQKRNIAGIQALQGQEFSFLVGVEPAQNGYDAKNKMTVVLTPDNSDYVASAGGAAPVVNQGLIDSMPPQGQAAMNAQAPAVTATAGVVPAWAQK
jgi:hypothetical protein